MTSASLTRPARQTDCDHDTHGRMGESRATCALRFVGSAGWRTEVAGDPVRQ